MPEKTRELKQLTDILHTWRSDKPLWIHLEGGPGSGKSYFIEMVLKGIFHEYAPVFRLSSLFTSLPKQEQLKKIFQSLLRNQKEDVESFAENFPGYLQRAILKMFRGAAMSRQQEIYSHPFTLKLLTNFLRFLAANKKLVVVLDGGFVWHSLNSYWLLRTLLQEIRLPLIIISSSSGDGRSEALPEYLHRIK
ncbi:MAG: ATP-binding protein, partial [Calditrichia bacterium]